MPQIKHITMNYEELLNSKEELLVRVSNLPLGVLYKKLLDRKFVCVLDIKERLLNNSLFKEALNKECDANSSIHDVHQIHFLQGAFDGDVEMLTLEQGNYVTFEQLLNDNPSVVAKDNFIENVVNELLEFASYLHANDIYHVCYSPLNVFVRKGETTPLLLSHGSYYSKIEEASVLYSNTSEFVAPEVLEGEEPDERSDVYSLGKFIEFLFTFTDMPLEYKKVVKKATNQLPEKRYQSTSKMLNALNNGKKSFQTIKTFVFALLIALIGVGAYFEFMPETEHVEFIKPAEETHTDDFLNEGFDPSIELGVSDSVTQLTPEQEAEMRKYQMKCESIFRKQYEKEADRILSKIYNNDYMGSNEKKFIAGSQSTIKELMDVQSKLANEANLDQGTSQRIATEIIDRITERKKAALQHHGIQK